MREPRIDVRVKLNVVPDPLRAAAATGHDAAQGPWQIEFPAELPGMREREPKQEQPMGGQAHGPRWQLDDVSLAALLRALGPDIEQASQKYSKLRERLCRFFEWNRAENADELADETLDRLARRLGRAMDANQDLDSAGGRRSREEAIERPEEFAVGIARLVLHEQRRRDLRSAQALEKVQRESETTPVAWRAEESRRTEELAAVLDECMGYLAREQQDLIRRYYSVEGRTMIDPRKRLADELGISVNALRNRALRIRAELESHVRAKLRDRS